MISKYDIPSMVANKLSAIQWMLTNEYICIPLGGVITPPPDLSPSLRF